MMSKHRGKLLGAIASAALLVAILAPAAHAATPAPGYSQFAGCPDPKTEAIGKGVEICLRATIKSGSFKMGSKTVPIEKPITLSGGTNVELENFVANSKGGMSHVKQKVPGGVVGLTGLTWLLELLGSNALTLYAETEAAGLPVFKGFEGLSAPIKVHLINPVLGNNCYIGSFANPIKLNLTTGTTSPPPPNKPISGHEATETVFDEELEITHLNNTKYVDNSFAAPGASGCVLTLFGFIPISINGLVNSQSGLPAAAGTNEAIQIVDTEATEPHLVYP
ncbi:MAG: hypothetical protein QOE75_114 [Solirubrobacterales bacterium]|jgi:hypothetical protein|nr:hypothetical protein [Solirubrobacterales bacterium]